MVREENIMKDRWIALYVENQVGVLAKGFRSFFRKVLQFTEFDRWNDRGRDGFPYDHLRYQ